MGCIEKTKYKIYNGVARRNLINISTSKLDSYI